MEEPTNCPTSGCWAEFRAAQQTPHGRAKLRERVKVEHTLAHVDRWQDRRARYLGRRKNLFDRIRGTHHLASSFLRHCGLSLW